MISAKIIADSINPIGNRITTMEVVMPRMILAEFNTHRMFSRNSASSRAIPFKKMVKMVKENPFVPLGWMKDHKGMQGSEYFTGKFKKWMMRRLWLLARTFAVIMATALHKNGLTKQICNRILEPFMWHTVLVTATEWGNFFALRANPAAEIHMHELANQMLIAYNESKPKLLQAGEWHMPYINESDYLPLCRIVWNRESIGENKEDMNKFILLLLKISTARCARLSYFIFGDIPKIDYKKDIKLHDDLSAQGHWSPFEHCAKCMTEDEYANYVYATPGQLTYENGEVEICDGDEEYGRCGNFKGFIQYRKQFAGENRHDNRIFPV